jgi:hypothetical protein
MATLQKVIVSETDIILPTLLSNEENFLRLATKSKLNHAKAKQLILSLLN